MHVTVWMFCNRVRSTGNGIAHKMWDTLNTMFITVNIYLFNTNYFKMMILLDDFSSSKITQKVHDLWHGTRQNHNCWREQASEIKYFSCQVYYRIIVNQTYVIDLTCMGFVPFNISMRFKYVPYMWNELEGKSCVVLLWFDFHESNVVLS